MRVLLVSLGTGPSVEHGIARSIRDKRPDRVIYLATGESTVTKDRVEALLSPPLPASEIVQLASGDDPNEVYRQACIVMKRLEGEGINLAEDAFTDFTSGTKAMSVGLFAAALAYGVHNLIYISGQRGQDGRVISGTERVTTFSPTEIFVDRLRQQIVALFNQHLFSAALQLIERGLREFHMPEYRQELEQLRSLCRAYQAWDWFDHQEAVKHFEKVDRAVITRWGKLIGDNKGWVNQIAKDLKHCSEELLIDLWLNAERRIEEKHWIDAVARLYRLVELIAQFRLDRQYGLDTRDLEVEKLPEALRPKYARLRDGSDGKVRLGLKQAYELLGDLQDELGQRYDDRLQGVLQARNDSIGGHGLRPVTGDDCCRLAQRVRELLSVVISDWEEKACRGRFISLQV